MQDKLSHIYNLSSDKIKSISKRNLLITLILVLGAYTIIKQLAGVDLSEVWGAIRSANVAWAILAFVVAQFILIPNATSMMTAVTARIPFKRTLILQSALQFIGVAVPSTAGRIATNIAYLKRFGVSNITAVMQGALDSFTGFIVQVIVIICAVIFGGANFDIKKNLNLDWSIIFIIFVGFTIMLFIIIYQSKSIRLKISNVLKDANSSLAGLKEKPIRLVALLGSNFMSQLMLALAFLVTAQAFGVSIPLSASLIIIVSASLLGGITPVPGGVGVQEAVISAGLISLGVNQDTAFAVTVLYRIFTFFLPPFWGFISFRWLTKNKYI